MEPPSVTVVTSPSPNSLASVTVVAPPPLNRFASEVPKATRSQRPPEAKKKGHQKPRKAIRSQRPLEAKGHQKPKATRSQRPPEAKKKGHQKPRKAIRSQRPPEAKKKGHQEPDANKRMKQRVDPAVVPTHLPHAARFVREAWSYARNVTTPRGLQQRWLPATNFLQRATRSLRRCTCAICRRCDPLPWWQEGSMHWLDYPLQLTEARAAVARMSELPQPWQCSGCLC